MSRLQELIQKLCPDGVEYKRLGSLCDLSRGKVYSKPYITAHEGNYPVYSSQTANDGELGRISTYDYDGEYLTWTTDGAYAGTIFHRKGKFSITNVCGLIEVKSPEILNLRFLYYWLSIKAQEYVYRGMGNPKLMSNQMTPIEIPIPPLSVQEEIVRILDAFTFYAAELQAELQARKEQYAYYRDQLLTFTPDDPAVKWMKLREVCVFINGFAFKSSLFKDIGLPIIRITNIKGSTVDLSDVKYFSLGDYNTDLTQFKISKGDILVAMSGATTGKVGCYIDDRDAYINQRVGKFVPNEQLLNKRYLFHFLISQTRELYVMAGGGAQPNLSSKKLMETWEIPIPSLSEQQRIVSILDKFEALVNDLTEGLPAEIAAVQEQYEYYRNKLLSFPRK